MRFDLLHPKALRAALIERVGEDAVPTERQVRRWVTGDSPIPGWARHTITELMGQTEEEPPEPPWVGRLERHLIQIENNQGVVADAASRRLIAALADPERLAWVERIASTIRDESRTQSAEGSDGPPASEAPGGGGPGGRGLGSSPALDAE